MGLGWAKLYQRWDLRLPVSLSYSSDTASKSVPAFERSLKDKVHISVLTWYSKSFVGSLWIFLFCIVSFMKRLGVKRTNSCFEVGFEAASQASLSPAFCYRKPGFLCSLPRFYMYFLVWVFHKILLSTSGIGYHCSDRKKVVERGMVFWCDGRVVKGY